MWKLNSKKVRRFEYTIFNPYRINGIIATGFCNINEIDRVIEQFNRLYGDNPQNEIKFSELMELDYEE